MPNPMSKNMKIATWVLRVVLAAGFLFMGAIPKLTGDPMAIEIFEKLGAEPAGRFGVGAAEALTAILLLVPMTGVYGGLLTIVMMLGALFTHFTKLGFPMDALPNEQNPPPMGFIAIVFLLLGGAVVFMLKHDLPLGKGKNQPAPE